MRMLLDLYYPFFLLEVLVKLKRRARDHVVKLKEVGMHLIEHNLEDRDAGMAQW